MSESTLCVNEKDIVVPGEVLAEGMSYIPGIGTHRKDQQILASNVGVVRLEGKVIKLVPLEGRYLPRTGDVII